MKNNKDFRTEHYNHYLNAAKFKTKGFWRVAAIGILNQKINKGQSYLEYLRNKISIHNIRTQFNTFLDIKSEQKRFSTKNLKIQTSLPKLFSLTQVGPMNIFQRNKLYKKIFINDEEKHIYNNIELQPFYTNLVRKRNKNEQYYNIQMIKAEFEKEYDNIYEQNILQANKNNKDKIMLKYILKKKYGKKFNQKWKMFCKTERGGEKVVHNKKKMSFLGLDNPKVNSDNKNKDLLKLKTENNSEDENVEKKNMMNNMERKKIRSINDKLNEYEKSNPIYNSIGSEDKMNMNNLMDKINPEQKNKMNNNYTKLHKKLEAKEEM